MKKKKKPLGLEWIFDQSPISDPLGRTERALAFLRLLKHPASTAPDKSIQIDRWQERILRRILETDRHGNRIVHTVYAQLGRGNRKTTLGAMLACLFLYGTERIESGEIVCGASNKKQGLRCFNEAKNIVLATKQLRDPSVSHVQASERRITHKKSKSFFEVCTSDAAGEYGRSIYLGLIDEWWAHKKTDLMTAIETGTNKVPNSLMVIMTTAGRGESSPDFELYQYAKRVSRGDVKDPSFLPIIFEADKDCDWTDEAVWHSVNPGLQYGYPDLAKLRTFVNQAKERPKKKEEFLQLHLGIRAAYSAAPFVDIAVFDEGRQPIDLDSLKGQECVVSLDYARTTDLCGLMATFRDGEDYLCKSWAFLPEEGIEDKAERDGLPYAQWAKDESKWLLLCDGPVISETDVEDKNRELVRDFDVIEIVCDPSYAGKIMQRLADDGLPVAGIQQGWKTQSPALNVLESAILRRKLKWDSPILRANMEAVKIRTIDDAGNRKMSKTLSKSRIDLAYCLWMGVSRSAALDGGFALNSDSFDPSDYLVQLW